MDVKDVGFGFPRRAADEHTFAVKRAVKVAKTLRERDGFGGGADGKHDVDAKGLRQLPRVVGPVDRKQGIEPAAPQGVIQTGRMMAGFDVLPGQRPADPEGAIRNVYAHRVLRASSVGAVECRRQGRGCVFADRCPARGRGGAPEKKRFSPSTDRLLSLY